MELIDEYKQTHRLHFTDILIQIFIEYSFLEFT